eukprot:13267768-Alexandrium_andersonii.AAC.1
MFVRRGVPVHDHLVNCPRGLGAQVPRRRAGGGSRGVEVYYRDSEDRPLLHGQKDWYFQRYKITDSVDLDSWRSGR